VFKAKEGARMRTRHLVVIAVSCLCFFCWLGELYRRSVQATLDMLERDVPLITMGGMEG